MVMEKDDRPMYPFIVGYIPELFQEKCARELHETLDAKIGGIQELKVLAKNHELTCDIEFVDDFLVQFLRQQKYKTHESFNRLLNFVQFSLQNHPLLESVHEEVFLTASSKYFTFLPKRSPDGCAIALCELYKWNSDEISFLNIRRLSILSFYQALRDPVTQINGIKIIYDFTNVPFKLIKYCTPHNLHLLYHGLQNCFPGRFKAFYMVNNHPLMKLCWTMIRSFLSLKMRNRVLFMSSRTDLLMHFPASVLPVKFGGVLEDYFMEEWMRKANIEQDKFALSGQQNVY